MGKQENFYKLTLTLSETMQAVIVDDADCLHPGIDDHRADEFIAAFLQRR